MGYAITFDEMNNCRTISSCSKSREKLEKYCIDNKPNRPYKIELFDPKFDYVNLDYIYTVTCDIDRNDIFVDIGEYFKTYEEASRYVKINQPQNDRKNYIIMTIRVIK